MSAQIDSVEPPRDRIGPVMVVICMVGTFALVVGYTYPALSLAMEQARFSPTMIGVHTAMTGVGIVVSALATPAVAARFGAWRLGVVTGIATVFVVLGFGISPPGPAWLAMRFALGLSISTLFVLSETWLNELVPPRLRGRLVATYTTAVAALFGIGPLLIPWIGYTGPGPFTLVALLVAVMLLPMWSLRHQVSDLDQSERGALAAVYRLIPVLIFAVLTFGMFDGAVMGLWVIYGIGIGYSEQIASWTLSASILGNLFLQLPIGWLADHMSRRLLLAICAASGMAGALALPLLDFTTSLAWPVLMLWGGLCFGTYTIALVLVGEHLRGAHLIAANAAFGLMWGLGAILGGSIAGGLMDLGGPATLPLFIAAIFGALTLATLAVPPVRTTAR